MEKFTRLSISLDTELKLDIDFDMMKVTGKTEPNNSYGAYFYKKLRDRVPNRNAINEEQPSDD